MKNVFLQISQNSQENTCARMSSLRDSITGSSCEFFEICKTNFLQNTFGRLLLYLEPCQISMTERFCGNTEAVAQRYFFKRCS